MSAVVERESLHYDVVVVGAGPAGLATAIRLKQLARGTGVAIDVCLLEKGAEIGAHILSGAVLDTRALDELIADWRDLDAPVSTAVSGDEFHVLSGSDRSWRLPGALVPPRMRNAGHFVVSVSDLCRWLGERAAELDIDVLAGFAASEVLYDDDASVAGVRTVDRGVAKTGERKASFEPGVDLRAACTVFAEGARGHLGREVIERFGLADARDPQHYGIGLKEVWEIDGARHRPGLVVHGMGWPLAPQASGGFFLYHFGRNLVSVGLVVDLNYRNPWLSPYDEFQRLKHHPLLREVLRGGKRIAYGARAITKGGLSSLPKMSMPGALLVGCDAGTLDYARIKGTHTAMKSGMIAAETIMAAHAQAELGGRDLDYAERFAGSWLHRELRAARNVGAALHHYGIYVGGGLVWLEQRLFGGRTPLRLRDSTPDHETLVPAAVAQAIRYDPPDGVLSFDEASSLFLSGTDHDPDQPCHLTLKDASVPIEVNLREFAAPEQRYCPAGVYEILDGPDGPYLQINAQNCLHCKVCDIKDPRQNIVWVPPAGGGPAYSGT